MDIITLVLMLVALGAVAGFLAGLLGVGGGIVLVPGLYYILSLAQPAFGFEGHVIMHCAIGTSLAVIVPTGFSSARAHHKKGGVDFDIVRMLGIGIVIGVVCATILARNLDASMLKMIFATALVVFAGLMMIDRSKFQRNKAIALPKQPFVSVAGFVIGSLSTLIGIGGATLSVPYMSLHGVAMHRAVGTASALGLVIAVPAALGFIMIGWGQEGLPPFSLGYINVLAWVGIIPISVMVAPLGARAAHKMNVKALKIFFAMFMILVAMNMWRKILMGG